MTPLSPRPHRFRSLPGTSVLCGAAIVAVFFSASIMNACDSTKFSGSKTREPARTAQKDPLDTNGDGTVSPDERDANGTPTTATPNADTTGRTAGGETFPPGSESNSGGGGGGNATGRTGGVAPGLGGGSGGGIVQGRTSGDGGQTSPGSGTGGGVGSGTVPLSPGASKGGGSGGSVVQGRIDTPPVARLPSSEPFPSADGTSSGTGTGSGQGSGTVGEIPGGGTSQGGTSQGGGSGGGVATGSTPGRLPGDEPFPGQQGSGGGAGSGNGTGTGTGTGGTTPPGTGGGSGTGNGTGTGGTTPPGTGGGSGTGNGTGTGGTTPPGGGGGGSGGGGGTIGGGGGGGGQGSGGGTTPGQTPPIPNVGHNPRPEPFPPLVTPDPKPTAPPGKVILELKVVQLNYEAWWKNCLQASVAGHTQDIACNKSSTGLGTTRYFFADKPPACNAVKVTTRTYKNQGQTCTQRMRAGLECEGPYSETPDWTRTPSTPALAEFFLGYDRLTIDRRSAMIKFAFDYARLKRNMESFRAGGANRWLRVFFEDQPKANLDAVRANPSLWEEKGIDYNDYIFDVKGEGVNFYVEGAGPQGCAGQ